eukprot:TRINITY_DN35596_c0_g1_i1.p1 TRINITY_DN35596_c0_g1~~TRINITY_DN35596_c0_g1_i1.p1  ORF type:complete len:487 (+),score=196.07 TRINITY_DN35596_c0_g1_i1:65-1525(+)
MSDRGEDGAGRSADDAPPAAVVGEDAAGEAPADAGAGEAPAAGAEEAASANAAGVDAAGADAEEVGAAAGDSGAADDAVDEDQLLREVADLRAAVEAKRVTITAARQHRSDTAQLQDLRERSEAAERSIASLEGAAQGAQEQLEAARKQSQESLRGIAAAAEAAHGPASSQSELTRQAHAAIVPPPKDAEVTPDSPPIMSQTEPSADVDCILGGQGSIVDEREREAAVLAKQIRELKMSLKLKRQREQDLTAEAERQINEVSAQKDEQILALVTRCLTERETILRDISDAETKSRDALSRLRSPGYVEDVDEKGKKVQELSDTLEAGIPQLDGQEKRGGERERAREVSLRCARPRRDAENADTVHKKRKEMHLELYQDSHRELTGTRDAVKSNRDVIHSRVVKTRELRESIAAETAAFEKQIASLRRQIAREKDKHEFYEHDNQRMFWDLERGERSLVQLQSKIHGVTGQGAPPARVQSRPSFRIK